MITAPQTDRAAIEALARELTDEQWAERFAELDRATWNPGTRIRESTRAMLAYLDETWAGLTTLQRELLHERALGTRASIQDEWSITPLGRACLKRAKDQGRA